jgi:hypothetical protein
VRTITACSDTQSPRNSSSISAIILSSVRSSAEQRRGKDRNGGARIMLRSHDWATIHSTNRYLVIFARVCAVRKHSHTPTYRFIVEEHQQYRYEREG